MVKFQRSLARIIFIILVSMTVSCKKDDDSAYALKNEAGNAYIYSAQYTVTWIMSDPGYYCNIEDENITQEVVDNGLVEVYMSNGSGGWIALPITMPVSADYSSTFTPVHYLGGLTIWEYDTDINQSADPGLTTFKIVCINPVAKLAHSDLDWNDYASVKMTFNL